MNAVTCRACQGVFEPAASGKVPGHGSQWQQCSGSYQPGLRWALMCESREGTWFAPRWITITVEVFDSEAQARLEAAAYMARQMTNTQVGKVWVERRA